MKFLCVRRRCDRRIPGCRTGFVGPGGMRRRARRTPRGAIQERGLKLVSHGRERVARVSAAEDPSCFRSVGLCRDLRASGRIKPTTAQLHLRRCWVPQPPLLPAT